MKHLKKFNVLIFLSVILVVQLVGNTIRLIFDHKATVSLVLLLVSQGELTLFLWVANSYRKMWEGGSKMMNMISEDTRKLHEIRAKLVEENHKLKKTIVKYEEQLDIKEATKPATLKEVLESTLTKK